MIDLHIAYTQSFLLLSPECTRQGLKDVVSVGYPLCYIVTMLVERYGGVYVDPNIFGHWTSGCCESSDESRLGACLG